jgi:hypothetical protein
MSQNNSRDRSDNIARGMQYRLRAEFDGRHAGARNQYGLPARADRPYWRDTERPLHSRLSSLENRIDHAAASAERASPAEYEAYVCRNDGKIKASTLASLGYGPAQSMVRGGQPDALFSMIRCHPHDPRAGTWPEPIATEFHPAIGQRGDHWAINKNPVFMIPPNTKVPPVGADVIVRFRHGRDYLSGMGEYLYQSAGPSIGVGVGDTVNMPEEESTAAAFSTPDGYNASTIAELNSE